MYSIYGFWYDIVNNKQLLPRSKSFSELRYKNTAFSYLKSGRGFPNFSIKLNKDQIPFTGGELVKIKNRNKYLIAPFKSTIPRGKIQIKTFASDPLNKKVQRIMEKAGDTVLDPFAGTGTTLVTANQLGRNSIGIEIDPKNAKMIQKRLEDIREADNIEKYYQEYIYTETLSEVWGIKSSIKIPAKVKSKQPSLWA